MKNNPNMSTKIHVSTQELQATHRALKTWGIYTLLESGENLNFLPKNILENISQLGLKIQKTTKNLHWPSIAERTDKLVNQLNYYNSSWAAIIKYHYLQMGTIRNKAQQYGLYKSTYYDRLCKGQYWIAKQLCVN